VRLFAKLVMAAWVGWPTCTTPRPFYVIRWQGVRIFVCKILNDFRWCNFFFERCQWNCQWHHRMANHQGLVLSFKWFISKLRNIESPSVWMTGEIFLVFKTHSKQFFVWFQLIIKQNNILFQDKKLIHVVTSFWVTIWVHIKVCAMEKCAVLKLISKRALILLP